jgi:hypothetical protein
MNPHGPHLRLVVNPVPKAARTRFPRVDRAGVRPGDRREPTPIYVDRAILQLVEAAAARGLDLDQAASLLVERALLLEDAAYLGMSEADAYAVLRTAASTLRRLAVPAATARYIRILTGGRALSPRREVEGRRHLALPVRLSARTARINLAQVLRADDLDEAIRLEMAAAASGRTMSEWALLAFAQG